MDNEKFTVEGGCGCQTIRYRMNMKPLFVHCCHCRWCQRESGTAFAINAMIEADKVELLSGQPKVVDTPSESDKGQLVSRCPKCQVAVWSSYPGSGPAIIFVRVGTLDNPDLLPPDIHIYTESKQPWVKLSEDVPVMLKFYEREKYWPVESLQRREAILPQIKQYQEAQKSISS